MGISSDGTQERARYKYRGESLCRPKINLVYLMEKSHDNKLIHYMRDRSQHLAKQIRG